MSEYFHSDKRFIYLDKPYCEFYIPMKYLMESLDLRPISVLRLKPWEYLMLDFSKMTN